MRSKYFKSIFWMSLLTVVMIGVTACGPTAETNTENTDANLTNTNENAANSNADSDSTAAIEAAEPDTYTATVAVSVGTTGAIEARAKALQAKVFRDGDKRRMEMILPNGEKVVYLTIGERQMVILPARKQYAEIDKESFGFELRKLVAPDQIVSQVKGYDRVTREGEEQWFGRDVVKYTIAEEAKTETQAGDVKTDSFVLVDKETRLPVKTVAAVTAAKGEVMGVTGLKAVTEITDLKTEADDAMFSEPTDFEKVSSEDIQAQLETFYNSARGLVGQLFEAAQNAAN